MVCFFLLLVNRCGCKDNKKNVNTTLFREKFLKKCVFNTKKEPAKTILEAPQQNKEAPQRNKEAPQRNKEAPQQNKEAPQQNKEAL